MALILDGTNGLSDVDGSAATPAIRGSDANTGIFFPAADTIAFAEGGVESMRLDSAGNVGIGTSSPGSKLSVQGDGTSFRLDGTGNTSRGILLRNTGTGEGYVETDGNMHFRQEDAGRYMRFSTANTERMRIDSSGNLLVGTTSVPSVNNARVGVSGTYTNDSNSTALADQRTTLVLRQDAGSSSNNQGAYSCLVLSASQGLSSNPGVLLRGYGGSGGGTYSIQINGNGNITNANNSYGSLSDINLKENVVDATPKLNDLMQVRVRNFNFTADEKKAKHIGVIAQELEEIFPGLVESETSGTKSVKYSVFVPMLVKAIQEQQAIITALTARVEALEGAQA